MWVTTTQRLRGSIRESADLSDHPVLIR
jgi:hypothetical protein